MKKDKECITCEYIFDCKGKPENVKQCLRYKERANGRSMERHSKL